MWRDVEKNCECLQGFSYLLQAFTVFLNISPHCKTSGLNNKFFCSIKQSNRMRWNSLLIMPKSIKKVENEVKNLLEEVVKMKRVDEIDFVLIVILIKFLEIFQEATLALEGDVYSTIHHVFQWYTKLQRSVARNATNLPILAFLKSVRAFSGITKTEMITLARSLFREQINGRSSSSRSDVVTTGSHIVLDHGYENQQNQMNVISKSSIDDEFSEWQNEETFEFDRDELNLYFLHQFEDDFSNKFLTPDGNFNILKFWLSAEI